MSQEFKPGDRVQYTRFYIINRANRVPGQRRRSLEDIGVIVRLIERKHASNRKPPMAWVKWIKLEEDRPDEEVQLANLVKLGKEQ